ncbi:hypothetical protein [Roseivivax sp.]
MAFKPCIPVLVAALALGAPGAAQADVPEGGGVPPREAAPLAAPELRLKAQARGDFVARRLALLDALGAAAPDALGPPLLDLAEFHIARGLGYEAGSYLARAQAEGLPAEEAPRVAALTLLQRILTGRADSLGQSDPLLSHPDWPAAPHLRAMVAVSGGARLSELAMLEAEEAAGALPDRILEVTLPVLLEAAVESDYWEIGHALAARMLAHSALGDSAAFHYLLGRAAERGGEEVAAFDSYLRAARGSDAWAHKGRLAIISLAVRTEALAPRERLTLLRQARWRWTRGPLGARTLMALAEAEIALSHRIAALEVLNAIGHSYPETLYAQKAATLAEAQMDAFYAHGLAGDLAIADFVRGHARIATDYRMEPGFAERAEAFADHMLANGITGLAAREYLETAEFLAVGQDLGLFSETEAMRDRLRLKRAEALFAGGQYALAVEVTRGPLLVPDPEIAARLAALRTDVYAATGRDRELLDEAPEDPARDYLRQRAEALFAQGDWTAALAAYEDVWAGEGAAMPPALAAHMLLAAHRAGQAERVRELAEALPRLDEAPGWAAIAARLGRERPDIFPLRRGVIEAAIGEGRDEGDTGG